MIELISERAMGKNNEDQRSIIGRRIIVSIACAGFLFLFGGFVYSAISFSMILGYSIVNEIISVIVLLAVCLGALVIGLFFIWKKLNGEMLVLFAKISLTLVSAFFIFIIGLSIYGNLDWGDLSYMAMPWALVFFFGLLFICMLFIWNFFKNRLRLISAICMSAIVAVTSIALIGQVVYESSVDEVLISEGDEISLYEYQPFREGTLAKSLDEPSNLRLQEDLPRLDGSTAHYPLYAAFVRATYPEEEGNYKIYEDDSIVLCSRTSAAFENLLDGSADVIFLMGVSDEQHAQAEARGLQLKMTPIGKEAFVFFVNNRNSMSDLTVKNIRDIYSGKVTNWREVGGSNDKIRAYLRAKNSGSQTMLEEIMGGIPLFEAPEEDYYDMMKEMYMAVAYKDYKNSLGFSFRYYIKDMINEDTVKFLSIEGVSPEEENIANGTYPFSLDFYAITVDREPASDEDRLRMENAEKLIDWILSPQGQTLVEKTGYVSLSE